MNATYEEQPLSRKDKNWRNFEFGELFTMAPHYNFIYIRISGGALRISKSNLKSSLIYLNAQNMDQHDKSDLCRMNSGILTMVFD